MSVFAVALLVTGFDSDELPYYQYNIGTIVLIKLK